MFDLNLFHCFVLFSISIYAFETYVQYRQYLKYQIKVKPKQLSHVTEDEFHKAQLYGQDKTKFAFVTDGVATVNNKHKQTQANQSKQFNNVRMELNN
jgi:hypothetical protein